MNNRLQQFLELENITPARLADTLGVQRSGISHILSGRNKPGYDFIIKLLSKFPHINSEWLLMGNGKPYKEMLSQKSASSPLPFSGSPNFPHTKNSGLHPDSNNDILYDSILYNDIQNNGLSYDNMQYDNIQYNGVQNGGNRQIFSSPLNETGNFTESYDGSIPDKLSNKSDNQNNTIDNSDSELSENRVNATNKGVVGQKKRIKRVIVFYSDGSFEELFPHIR